MLPKKNRANTKVVDEIFKRGRFVNSTNLSFKFLLNNSPSKPQISFIAPKSIAGSAVKRNSLRRRGYKALEKYLSRFPLGIQGTLVFKTPQSNISEIENEIKTILNKIN
ncbi:MAG: ribonuclease P protein component [Patescibacteria group bacterium]